MKNICKILSILLICILFTACTADKAQEPDNSQLSVDDKQNIENTTPDGSGLNDDNDKNNDKNNDKDSNDSSGNIVNNNPAASYVEWPGTDSLNKNGFNCARVTLTRELNDGGYDDTGLVFRKDTIKYELGRGFATGLNYILTLTDDKAYYNYISYKAFEFTVDFSADDKDAITLIYARRTNDMSNCLGIKNGTEITWLKKEAVGYFEVLCLNNGLTQENFLFLQPVSSLVTMNAGMPFVLKDENREKTPEQAAKELLLGILEEYSAYAYNRTFVVKSYTDWPFKLYDSNSDIGGEDVHGVKSLGENQWLVSALEPDAVIEGPREEGGSEVLWLLEYTNGQWQLWTRRNP